MIPRVKLLLRGEHGHNHPDVAPNVRMHIDPLTSSATLIVGKSVTVVDTGTPPYAPEILKSLEAEGIRPEDVEHLLITHWHQDHWRNCGMFPNATLIIDGGMVLVRGEGTIVYRKCVSSPDWVIMPTPGHTEPHFSVLVRGYWDKVIQKIVIAGDAVREDLVLDGYYTSSHVRPHEWASARLVLTSGDVVIPGHYDVIEKSHREELLAMLDRPIH